ncbi:hypothetical protein ACSVBT_07695 [Afipia sp. TerB]
MSDKTQRISDLIESIIQYTSGYQELQQAHHFLFDKRLDKNGGQVNFLIMGINPGETKHDWEVYPKSGNLPLEETSRFNFQANKKSESADRWYRRCVDIMGTDQCAMTEAFFWTSYDLAQMKERYGSFAASSHVKFCARINKELITLHEPKAVIFVGLGFHEQIAELYSLSKCRTILFSKDGNKRRLMEHYTDGTRPWIFMKHWSGARPSKEEFQKMRETVRELI